MLDIFHYAILFAWLVCFVYVVVNMFQNGSTVLGIVCLVTGCFMIGQIIAFIVGWVKSGPWNIKGLMMVWTVIVIAEIVLSLLHPAPFVGQLQQQLPQFQGK